MWYISDSNYIYIACMLFQLHILLYFTHKSIRNGNVFLLVMFNITYIYWLMMLTVSCVSK